MSSVSGTLRLSAPPSISDSLLVPLVGAFQASYPDVRVHAFVTEWIVDHIAEGIDLVFPRPAQGFDAGGAEDPDLPSPVPLQPRRNLRILRQPRETPGVRLFVGVTDRDWFDLLASQAHLDEVNFWQPGGNRLFRALAPGELFLFKLHSPDNFIVGGGLFAHATLLPASLAWEAFGIGNGARSSTEMRARIAKYRREGASRADYPIGCILLEQPFFLPREAWIPVPEDWSRNIVQGKGYDATQEAGAALYSAVQQALFALRPVVAEGIESPAAAEAQASRFGSPTLVFPRLGQGSFRVVVTDAYDRRCAASGERTLPVLQAAHIKPYADGGPHEVDNGLLLRSDLHTLFDRGYLTITPDARIEVSGKIREEFDNGRDYYALHGQSLRPPSAPYPAPSAELLAWHNEHVFLG